MPIGVPIIRGDPTTRPQYKRCYECGKRHPHVTRYVQLAPSGRDRNTHYNR